MNLNFTGINNIKIGKKQYEQTGIYQTLSKELARGEKQYTELKISAQLTDDERGNHLTDFKNRAPKMFINPEKPDTIELHVKRFDVPEDYVSQSMFKLNGKNLVINDHRKLPLMTFLARFTRESSQNHDLSEGQRQCMKLANDSIHKEAVNYIEAS